MRQGSEAYVDDTRPPSLVGEGDPKGGGGGTLGGAAQILAVLRQRVARAVTALSVDEVLAD